MAVLTTERRPIEWCNAEVRALPSRCYTSIHDVRWDEFVMPSEQEFEDRLRRCPNYDFEFLTCNIGGSQSVPKTNYPLAGMCDVPVDAIIGNSYLGDIEGWNFLDDKDHSRPYDIAVGLSKGTIHFGDLMRHMNNVALLYDRKLRIVDKTQEKISYEMEPPYVLEFGGLYRIVVNGNHRVGALKGLGIPGLTVPARSGSMQYRDGTVSLKASRRTDIPDQREELYIRLQQGLWSGTFDWATGTGYGSSEIGPWVFAPNMDEAEEIFRSVRPDLYPVT